MDRMKSQSLSVALHLALLGLGFLIGSRSMVNAVLKPRHPRPAPLYFTPPRIAVAAKSQDSGGASAGELPARRGTPPPKSNRTFIPPAPERPEPKLPLPASVAFDLPPVLSSNHLGDLAGKIDTGSLGIGGYNGIGDHGGRGGIGTGDGSKPGLAGRASSGPITPAKLIYKIEPEFSEEARKAKFQGTVVLAIEVDSAGNAGNFRVISSPGLGLGEKAIEAVARWRFKPAYRDGKPVISSARVEVNFRLL